MTPLTTAELAAFLGITPSAIRQAIRRHQIKPVGKTGKAHLYDPTQILAATGTHDRLAKQPQNMSQ